MTFISYKYRARLRRVIDGDTVSLDIDLGFYVHAEITVRLVGLNAPEGRVGAGATATAFAIEWFAEPNRTDLYVEVRKNPEKYGRWLGIITDADGHNLNDAILASGNAVPYNP